MSILIREVKILDPRSTHHNKTFNVFIKNGKIADIDKTEHRADVVIEGKGQILTPGWLDLRSNFNDPGHEYKEDIDSGCRLAARSGFTGVAVLPNTDPIIQAKSHIEYVKSKSRDYLTDIFPIAAVSLEAKGEDLTEMLDLHHAGAVAFSDGEQPQWHTDVLLKSLIYLQKIDGLLMSLPEDHMLTRFGTMNEGVVSTTLGMKGMPALAEHLTIKRDLDVLEYAGGKIHFSNISSKESITLIKAAKRKGLKVTCDVSIHHLLHTDEDVMGYDTNFKSNPPFRSNKDRKALIEGLKEGVIDAIVSSHTPQDEESKKLEFDRAEFGLTGLQTLLPGLLSLSNDLDLKVWIPKITTGPRMILGLEEATCEKNQIANLTLFNPKKKWTFDDAANLSKSRNSPYFNQELTGSVSAVFNGNKYEAY
ncbi:MAG: dihydroorotase [Reichenbachiella sp.]